MKSMPQKAKQFDFLPLGSSDLTLMSRTTPLPTSPLLHKRSHARYNGRLNRLEDVELEIKPRILFGIRPCDASAAALLDTVFSTEENNDPYWSNRRKETLLIGLGCDQPPQTCFCTTVGGGPFNTKGLDALMTEMENAYFVEVFSDEAEKLFADLTKSLARAAKADQSSPGWRSCQDDTSLRDRWAQREAGCELRQRFLG